MPTILGETASVPSVTRASVLSFASSPVGTFTPNMEFNLTNARAALSSADLPQITFHRRFGKLFDPGTGGTFATRLPDGELVGKWVTLRLSGPTGLTPVQVMARVVQEKRTVFASDVARTGVQTWIALGAFQLLRKINVSKSYQLETTVIESERVPSFNARDERGMIVGNRSTSTEGLSYVFGGTDTWTRRQAVDYLLVRFAALTGYTWTVSGDTALLDSTNDTVEMGQIGTLANSLSRILSPQFSLDFDVVPTPLGFEIRVISLSALEVTFLSVTVPRNPRRTRIVVGERPDVMSATVSRSWANRYSKIRVTGARVVVAFTLDAAASTPSLIPKWKTALHTSYLAGTGTSADAAHLHDDARLRDELRSVFAIYGAPYPFELGTVGAAVSFDASGQLNGSNANHQSTVRSTLSWTPLRAGHSYETGSEVNNSITDHEADFLAPACWIYDESSARYLLAEHAGFSVSAPGNDWGAVLRSSDMPHLIGLNDFAGAEETEFSPKFALTKIVATIAVRLDTRLTMEATLEDGEDDGTVLEIRVPGAEYWIVAKGTTVGLSATGTLQETNNAIVLRDDGLRMAGVMAAAKASYLRTRAQGSVRLRGLQPWAQSLGSVLTVVEQSGEEDDLGAVITSVDFFGGTSPRTRILGGYQ